MGGGLLTPKGMEPPPGDLFHPVPEQSIHMRIPKRGDMTNKTANAQPDLNKALDILAWLNNELGISNDIEFVPLLETIRDFLRWVDSKKVLGNRYDDLFGGHVGTYYLVACALEHAGLITHGLEIRYPALTVPGRTLLRTLTAFPLTDVEQASGTAYDGEWHATLSQDGEKDEAEDDD
jgi:hypothetical protein